MSSAYTLYDSFDISGKWNLPNCEHAVSGTIHYNRGKRYLETEGQIEGEEQSFANEIKNPNCSKLIPIIHGLLITGEKVTITKSILCHYFYHPSGIPTCQYTITDLFIGESYESINDIVFEKLDVDYSNLKDWYGVTGITRGVRTKEISASFTSTILNDIVAKLNEDMSIKIITRSSFQHDCEEQRATINESPSWVFESKSQLSYKEFYDYANCYRHFLMLGMGVGVYFVSLVGTIGNTEVVILPNTIIAQKLPKGRRELMLFRYKTIERNFSEHIQTWHTLWKKFTEPITNYFTMIDRREKYMLHSLFLTTAVCLESFHKYRFPKKEQYLKVRIKKLISHCPDAFENVETEQCDFTCKVIDNRNYLAHGFPKSETIPKNSEFFYLLPQMQSLIEGCFLKELPFDDSTLKEIMQMNRKEKNHARDNDECSKHSTNPKTNL